MKMNRSNESRDQLSSIVTQVQRPISPGQNQHSSSSAHRSPNARSGKTSPQISPDVKKQGGKGFLTGVLGCFRSQQAAPGAKGTTPRKEFKPFLEPQLPRDVGKKTLVLDLDETLVHSSFRPVPNAAFVIPVCFSVLLLMLYACGIFSGGH
eukprot:GHVR01137888.1.p1 GENE.GHVR01137888.1~~GHVR01137888.1.p1  ORF type:complete len:151 (+),score=7.61 GHVR01137888.1:28-480(+)